MKLEWFRTHKKFVYYVLLPVVGGGMAFFGLGSAFFSHTSNSAARGPSITYRIAGKERTIGPVELVNERMSLANFYSMNDVPSVEAGLFEVQYHTGLSSGLEVGEKELKDNLRQQVKNQVMQRERTQNVTATEEIYRKLLEKSHLTQQQFEQITYKMSVWGKYAEVLQSQMQANDGQVFVAFCHEKEEARFRFSVVKSEDYQSKAKAPTTEEIKKYYDDHKDMKDDEQVKDILFTKPVLSADVLYLNPEKLLAELKPTDPELQSYYDRFKTIFWKEAADPKTPGAPDKFKAFNDVKADVEQKWKDDEKRKRPNSRLATLQSELKAAEQKHKEEQEKKPEAERTKFDIDGWAKKNDLIHWTTDKLTEEEFKNGKKELLAKNAGWVESIFGLKHDSGNPRMNELNAIRFEDWTYPQALDPKAPEKGLVIARKNAYEAEQLKPLDQATPAITEQLKIDDAVAQAEKEARKIHDEWADGKNLPAIDTLEEVNGNSTSQHPLVQMFFQKPKPVGEPIDVASGPADEKNEKNAHRHFYIGFAVERKTPSPTTFEKDTAYPRSSERMQIVQSDFQHAYRTLTTQLRELGEVRPRGVKDPPLFEHYGRGEE